MIETAAGTICHAESRFRDERAKNQRDSLCKSKPSRRLATVRLQQPAKAPATSNITDPYRLIQSANAWPLDDRFVVQRLVRSFFVIMRGEFTAQMVQVFGAQDNEVVEALPTKRLNEALDIGVHVRGTETVASTFDLPPAKPFRESCRQFAIAIVLNSPQAQPAHLCVSNEVISLLDDPGFIGVQRGSRNNDLPR